MKPDGSVGAVGGISVPGVPEFMVEPMDGFLGRPRRDPVPAADGSVEHPDVVQLAGVAPGAGS